MQDMDNFCGIKYIMMILSFILTIMMPIALRADTVEDFDKLKWLMPMDKVQEILKKNFRITKDRLEYDEAIGVNVIKIVFVSNRLQLIDASLRVPLYTTEDRCIIAMRKWIQVQTEKFKGVNKMSHPSKVSIGNITNFIQKIDYKNRNFTINAMYRVDGLCNIGLRGVFK